MKMKLNNFLISPFLQDSQKLVKLHNFYQSQAHKAVDFDGKNHGTTTRKKFL